MGVRREVSRLPLMRRSVNVDMAGKDIKYVWYGMGEQCTYVCYREVECGFC